NQGEQTVHFYGAQREGDFVRQGLKKPVYFFDDEYTKPQQQHKRRSPRTPRITHLSEDRLWDHGETSSGVLSSLCNALYISLRDRLSRQLIVTVAIQSLKQLGHGE